MVSGVDMLVAILMASDMPIIDSGVSNTLYVTSSSDFTFQSSGVDSTSEISSPSVSVELSGTTISSSIKGDVGGSVSGVDVTLIIEGDATLTVDGVNVSVKATSCVAITGDGVDTSCETTTDTVTVTDLPCLASTVIAQSTCNVGGGGSDATMLCYGAVASVLAWVVALVL